MAENSKIEWTDHTFNPWIGCTKVSPACDHCYAEAWDARFKGERWGPHAPRTKTSAANWRKPIKWNREAQERGIRYRVFCASLADVFDNHKSIDDEWRALLWFTIYLTPHLDWLMLTKRPQNIVKMLPEAYGLPEWGNGWPNVWLGTTVENQAEADRRIPHLLATPAAVRFVSAEPLLGPVEVIGLREHFDEWGNWRSGGGIQWVIVGGESGPGARPMHPDWARSLRDQCADAGVAFHFKQWGEWVSVSEVEGPGEHHSFDDGATVRRVGKTRAGRLLDGVEHNGMPEVRR
jgi:protein gp37